MEQKKKKRKLLMVRIEEIKESFEHETNPRP